MAILGRNRAQIALSVLILLLLVPLVLTAMTPILAPIPAQTAGWSAAPLPDRDEALPGFQDLLEPLPLLVRDLPDASSQQVIAIYDQTAITDADQIRAMLETAHAAVPVPSEMEGEWDRWFSAYLEDPIDAGEVPLGLLNSLTNDRENGDRLSNFAVSLYYYGIIRLENSGSIDSYNLNAYNPVFRHAVTLLLWVNEEFPASRAALLNLVYLGRPIGSGGQESTALLENWVKTHPNDLTAIHLLALLTVGHPELSLYTADPSWIVDLLINLSDSPDTHLVAMTTMAIGDSKLSQAYATNAAAPFTALFLANEALTYYDRALAISDDAAIYVARASALQFLGLGSEAVETLELAVSLYPTSVGLRTSLAELYLEQIWHGEDVDKAARKSYEMNSSAVSVAGEADPVLLSALQMHPFPGEGNHAPRALGVSRLHLPYLVFGTLSGGRGAGIIYSFDLIPAHQGVPVGLSQVSYQRPFSGMVLAALLLGDVALVNDSYDRVETLMTNSRWFWGEAVIPSELRLAAVSAARLVDNWNNPDRSDLATSWAWAARVLRFSGRPERAAKICQQVADPSVMVYRDAMAMMPLTCEAENLYLAGDYTGAMQTFDSVGSDLMVGFVAERAGDVDEAVRRYTKMLNDPDQRLDGGDIAQFRLAGVLIQNGDFEGGIRLYSEWISNSEEWECDSAICLFGNSKQRPTGYGNRGVARLQMSADDNGNIDCAGEDWQACSDAFIDFDSALKFDPHNPVFLMNQAWVTRLLGDHEFSAELMNKALQSDTSLYPVLNDLGVAAVHSGDTSSANQYFQDAIAANPRYDLALWNMGVLKMQEGMSGIFRGQAYLARAIYQNPSLIGSSLEFRSDERVYRVEINETLRPGAGWSFGMASSIVTSTLGFLTFVLMTMQIAVSALKSKLEDIINGFIDSASKWGWQRFANLFAPILGARGLRWLPLVIALAILVFTTSWIARRADPTVSVASASVALFAVVLAVVVHEAAHSLTARRLNAVVQSAQWAPGMILALALLPFGLGSGPYPSQKVTSSNEATATRVYLAGPLANLVVAGIAYSVFVLQPVPALRLISQVQLAAMAYALLPFEPLDGAFLSRTRPKLVGALGAVGLVGGILFGRGVI